MLVCFMLPFSKTLICLEQEAKKFLKKKLFRLPNADQMEFLFSWIQLDNDIDASHIVPTFFWKYQILQRENL